MRRDKKILLLLFVIVLIIIILCLVLIWMSKNNIKNTNIDTNKEVNFDREGIEIYSRNSFERTENENDLIAVEIAEKKYFDNISNDEILKDITNFEEEKSVINQWRQIATNSTKFNYYVEEAYIMTIGENDIYLTKGEIFTNNDKYEIHIKVTVDIQNSHSYIIESIQKEMYERMITDYKEGELEEITVEKNKNNSFGVVIPPKDKTFNEYFSYFYDYACVDLQTAYNMLNQEYRDKRFGSVQKFGEYIKNAQNEFENFSVISYTPRKNEENVYVVQGSNQKNYIIMVSGARNLEFQLDDYTLETDDFAKTYMNASDEVKVRTAVEKFVKMISNYDYDGAYKLLDETYKNNNFKTVQAYEQYIKTHFYLTNIYSIDNITMQGNYYVVKLTTKQDERAAAYSTTNQIVISLGSSTDYTMAISL